MARLLAAAPSSPADAGIVGDEPAIPARPAPVAQHEMPTQPGATALSDAIDGGAAQELLTSVGFLLVPGAPFSRGASYLMIALRHVPTLAHFDPERIEFWTRGKDGASAPRSVDWPMAQVEPRYAWGPITIVDRVRARNEFASFGGRLTVARDGERHAALFRSEAPILAVGGHSGPADPLAVHLNGFFAVLRAASGDSSTRNVIDSADPVGLYVSFLVRTLAMFQARSVAGASAPRVSALLNSELRRLQRERPVDVQDGLHIAGLF